MTAPGETMEPIEAGVDDQPAGLGEATPDQVDAVGDQAAEGAAMEAEHREAEDAERPSEDDFDAAFEAAYSAVDTSFDVAKVEAIHAREDSEGSFTNAEMTTYTGFAERIRNAEAGTERALDVEGIRQEIESSGLDQEAVDALLAGVQQYENGETIDIPTATDIDESIDGTVEETEDIDDWFRDTIERGVELATDATGVASTIATEVARMFTTGRIDMDKIMAALEELAHFSGDHESAEEDEEFEANVSIENDTSLHDLFDDIGDDEDILYTIDRDSDSVTFDLSGVRDRGDMPAVIRMDVENPDLIGNSSVLDSDTVQADEALFPGISGPLQVRFMYQTIDGGWAELPDTKIADEFEFAGNETEEEEAVG